MFQDSKMPTEWQRQKLCEMIHKAFLKIRILGWQGESEQAADLADAFHELPTMLYNENLSLNHFRQFLESYFRKYPQEKGTYFDFLHVLDKIIKEEKS